MNLSIIPISTKSPSFKQNSYTRAGFKVLKELPHVTCACCGEKTINPEYLKKAIASLTLPLKKMMAEEKFQCWQKSLPIWNFLTDLANKFPNKSLDKLELDINAGTKNEILDVIKQSIINSSKNGSVPINVEHQKGLLHQDLLNTSRSHLRSAGVVMKRLAVFKECLVGDRRNVFEQLEIYAQKYPRKTLSEILNMEKIYKFHECKNLLQRTETREKSDYHFNNIANMVKKINPCAYEYFPDLKDEALSLLELEVDIDARLPKMKELFKKYLERSGCMTLLDKVYKELEQIPLTYTTADSFFVKAHQNNMSDFQIISAILNPSRASVEHIVPRSKNGQDIVENTIIFCDHCNYIRGNKEYSEFINYHPRMPYNVQKQLLQISEYILKGYFQDDLKFYPFQVAETLKDYTCGKIDIDVSSYCKKGTRVFDKKISKDFESINSIKEERNRLAEEKEALLRRIEEIDNERALKKLEIADKKWETSQDLAVRKRMQSYLVENKQKK